MIARHGRVDAAKGARQQFDHHAQARALVLPKGLQRAAKIECGRVERFVAGGVAQHARRDQLTFGASDTQLAFGHARGGEIKHQRRFARPARRGHGKGVGAHQPPIAAKRRNRGAGVAQCNTHHSCCRDHFHIRADPANVVAVTDVYRRHALCACNIDCRLGSQPRGGRAPAQPAIDLGGCAAACYQAGAGGGQHLAAAGVRNIPRQAQHAVRVVAHQVCLHQRVGHNLGDVGGAADGGEGGCGELAELRFGHRAHAGLPFVCGRDCGVVLAQYR